MRLVYMSDPHGRSEHFDTVFRLVAERAPDVLVLSGDLVPLVRTVQAQLDWIASNLRPRLSVHRARGGCPVLIIPGNHESSSTVRVYDELAEEGLCLQLHGRRYTLGGWEFLGFALVPPSPWYVKQQDRRDLPDDPPPQLCRKPLADVGRGEWQVVSEAEWFAGHPSLAEELTALPAPDDWRRTVFLCHSPPAQTGLDTTLHGLSVGSQAIRSFILKNQMRVALHGHIHEAPQMAGRCACRLGATLCINAGQDLGGTCAAVFDLEDPAGTWWHSQGLSLW